MEANYKALAQLDTDSKKVYFQTLFECEYYKHIINYNNISTRWIHAKKVLDNFENYFELDTEEYIEQKKAVKLRLMTLTISANEAFKTAISYFKRSFGQMPLEYTRFLFLDQITAYYDILNESKEYTNAIFFDPHIKTYEDDDYTEEALDQERK